MGLFSAAQVASINAVAARSAEVAKPAPVKTKTISNELNRISAQVLQYFRDSPAELITTVDELDDYVDACIEAGYAGIDCETTGLDRVKDHIVGFSLYCPGRNEVYIPNRHVVPIFETLYKNQLTYEQCRGPLQRLVDNHVRLVFANADFDLAMFYRWIKVDLVPAFYFDVITAWRCLREDEKDNTLKGLYAKYPKKGAVDPKKFSDFFPPSLFPYCKPEVAKLYAANDAFITYDLMIWELPFITKSNAKCQKHHLEKIADLIWNIEFPMVAVCAHLHRRGMYIDQSVAAPLHVRYANKLEEARNELAETVQQVINEKDVATNRKRPFATGKDFNPNSSIDVSYLFGTLLGYDMKKFDKEALNSVDHPAGKQILAVRKGVKLLGTYIDKMPKLVDADKRLHGCFKAIGADTGRMASSDPNLQNIPSKMHDIRHMFAAAPEYTTQEELNGNKIVIGIVDEVEVFNRGWKEASKLTVDDVILDSDANRYTITNIQKTDSEVTLTLEGAA